MNGAHVDNEIDNIVSKKRSDVILFMVHSHLKPLPVCSYRVTYSFQVNPHSVVA